ncbi:MAG: hypothetical protein RBR81_07350 [Bacteroidales bacterium]|nr:hypothetical protein [Bacteroidales bacterium]
MIRAVKIKAHILLISWAVIFAHSTIPHNHHYTDHGTCHNLIHTEDHRGESSDDSLKFETTPAGTEACHYDSLLFHHFASDNLIKESVPAFLHDLSVITVRFIIPDAPSFIAEPYQGTSSLRAPPLS